MKNKIAIVALFGFLMLALIPTAKAVTATVSVVVGSTYTTEVGQRNESDVTWVSSDTTVATVSSLGVITGVKVGNATITGTGSAGTTHTFTVNVINEGTSNPKTASEWYIYALGLCVGLGLVVAINSYKKSKSLS